MDVPAGDDMRGGCNRTVIGLLGLVAVDHCSYSFALTHNADDKQSCVPGLEVTTTKCRSSSSGRHSMENINPESATR
jgi:hypothetical protein